MSLGEKLKEELNRVDEELRKVEPYKVDMRMYLLGQRRIISLVLEELNNEED